MTLQPQLRSGYYVHGSCGLIGVLVVKDESPEQVWRLLGQLLFEIHEHWCAHA